MRVWGSKEVTRSDASLQSLGANGHFFVIKILPSDFRPEQLFFRSK